MIMKQTRNIALAVAMAACSTAAHAEVTVYPAGKDVPTIQDFTIDVRQSGSQEWLPVDAYPVVLQNTDLKGGKVVTVNETASTAYFDFDGTVEVRVISNKAAVDSARIRPLSYKLTPKIDGDTLFFTLARPVNISVEVNGDIFHNLHLFANPLDTNRPSAKVLKNLKKHKDLIYFGPGLHIIAEKGMKIPSNTTVYVDGGALVQGQLVADSVENVRFFGRGEIRPKGRGEGIYIRNSRNIEAEGVIVSQIPVGGSDSVTITNVKSLTNYGWGDGMNVFASDNVHYDRVFCRNSDDCSTIYATRKGFVGGCRNFLMENSTLWADVAHPIMIGLHGAATEIGVDAPADTICNVIYRNLDILDQHELQKDYQGVFGISCGDNNFVRNLLFEDIRVEDFRCGQLFNIRIFFNDKYCKAPGSLVENVTFKDITYNGSHASTSIICGYDENRVVRNLIFDNVVINGVRLSQDMPGKPKWYKPGDMCDIYIGNHVKNVLYK